jgi:hypothetical protein
MTSPIRVAGRSRDQAGRLVLWSVAEGDRGRRWREAALDGGSMTVARSVTLETGLDRRPTRLEIATGGGLVALHPEADGMIHGNQVHRSGVFHVQLDTAGGLPLFDLPGSPMLDAALCWALAPEIAVGEARDVIVVRLWLGDRADPGSLSVGTQDLHVHRATESHWSLGGSGLEPRDARFDPDGLPMPEPVQHWPLELEAEATDPA